MSLRKSFALFWWGGLALFALVIALGLPLEANGAPGIVDHQAAGSARAVNAIHAAWAAESNLGQARMAMLADLVFIGVYSIGLMLGGWYFWRTGTGAIALLGLVALAAGAVFLVTDYGETIAQFIQLMRERGGDRLAVLAATLQPPKIAAWIAGTLAIVLAFIGRRLARLLG